MFPSDKNSSQDPLGLKDSGGKKKLLHTIILFTILVDLSSNKKTINRSEVKVGYST
jgi:hypothetical protein